MDGKIEDHMDFAAEFEISCVCRICGDLKADLIGIYENEGFEKNISDKINKHFDITVNEQDSLPLKICRECFNLIYAFSQLYDTCSENEKKLKLLLVENANSQISQIQSKESLGGVDLELILDDELQFAENTSIPMDEFNKSGSSIEVDIDKDLDRIFGKTVMDTLDGELQGVKTFECEFCSHEGFQTIKELNSHYVEFHTDLVFCCDNCNNYINRNSLIEHMMEHVKEENVIRQDGPKNCKVVEIQEVPTNSNEMKPNASTADMEKVNEPDKNKTTTATTNTNPPEKKHTSNSLQTCSKVKVLKKCYSCDKVFANRSGRLYHFEQVHLNIKRFQCGECNMKFGLKQTLENHIKNKHSSLRQYKCECGSTYKTYSALYNHKNTSHNKNPRFECQYCEKKFHFNFLLEQHEKIHENPDVKDFVCDKCNKSFQTRSNLTKHKSIHSNENFNCKQCTFTCTLKRYLVAHEKRMHSSS